MVSIGKTTQQLFHTTGRKPCNYTGRGSSTQQPLPIRL
jgi:hypothetical protein